MKQLICIACLLASGVVSCARAQDWKPAPNTIMTPWADKVDPKAPLPEYPRPQLVRKDWVNLNGLWDYAIVARDAAKPEAFEGKILVPFPVESALSGVKKPLLPDQRLWYRRAFKSPSLGDGKRLLLHFGAVDWEANVWVNGKPAGSHKGGYDGFTFDITDLLKSGDNELVVSAWDGTGGVQPRGKQNLASMKNPGGIMYTPCSGIWQTVWLEAVPALSIDGLKITPDLDGGAVKVRASVRQQAKGQDETAKIEVVALDGGKEVAKVTAGAAEEVSLSIPNAKPWSADSPFLYDLKVTLRQGDKAVDAVESYFGMRKIALGKDDKGRTRMFLNNKLVFHAGPLDQGFWPDGIYTAPTDEALKFDIEMTKKLGYNAARKHVKVEPQRWYYWCDKLGLLVWQDMPSGGAARGGRDGADGTPASKELADQFEGEMRAMVEQHYNHPSIVIWVVFNEGWGQYDTVRLTNWVKQLDPTRLANNASGWTDRKCGDMIDMHNYPGPGSPKPEDTRAAVLGEFGGLGLPVPGHMWVDKSWGYRAMAGQDALNRRYIELWKGVWELKESAGLSAAIYTQTTDVETEANGLMSYDRKVVKVDIDTTSAAVAKGEFPPMPEYKVVVPSSQKEAQAWRYTTDKPADAWFKTDFDASAWKEGPGGFGTRATPGAAVKTEWRTGDIWLRREFTLEQAPAGKLVLWMHHDEDAEVYINGVLAARMDGYLTDYEPIEIAPEALAAIKPGKNTIAIHCHQTGGGQYIDAGLSVLVPPPAKK